MDKNQDNEWGPGHELGHMHQGAINWPSTTESSNNLFSNYVVYKINQWGSRGSSIGTLATYRYAPPTPWSRFMHPRDPNTLAFTPQDMTSDDANKYGLYQGEASEMHMRLNQQLWTYLNVSARNRIPSVRYSSKDVPLNSGYLSMIREQRN